MKKGSHTMKLVKKPSQNHLGNEKAFTLIELMIVIAILSGLAAIAFGNYGQLKSKTYDTTALVDTRNLIDSIVNVILSDEDVNFSAISLAGAVGIEDRAGNPRAPVFSLSSGVSAIIIQLPGIGPYNIQAEVYHTRGTTAPATPSGKKEFSCMVDEAADLVSLP
jgi:prepilin-type N-terminal cleavage/methylation domain-containing protein